MLRSVARFGFHPGDTFLSKMAGTMQVRMSAVLETRAAMRQAAAAAVSPATVAGFTGTGGAHAARVISETGTKTEPPGLGEAATT